MLILVAVLTGCGRTSKLVNSKDNEDGMLTFTGFFASRRWDWDSLSSCLKALGIEAQQSTATSAGLCTAWTSSEAG